VDILCVNMLIVFKLSNTDGRDFTGIASIHGSLHKKILRVV